MGRIKQGIHKGLNLHLKWVRIMLSVSTISILGLIFVPKIIPVHKSEEIAFSIDSVAPAYDDTKTSDTVMANTIRREVLVNRPANIDRRQPAPPPPPKDTVVSTATEPLQIQIITEPKSFDWKGTITWLIGAINGLVLVVLNIKNLLLKKT